MNRFLIKGILKEKKNGGCVKFFLSCYSLILFPFNPVCTHSLRCFVLQPESAKENGITLQTHHMYSTLKRRGNDSSRGVSAWNTRGVFVGNDMK